MTEHASGDVDFDHWLTPDSALGILPQTWGYETKTNWIFGRLRSGLIIAASRSYQSINDSIISDKIYTLTQDIWQECERHREADFWQTGDVTFSKASSSDWYSTTTIGTAFDVRFNPAGFTCTISPRDNESAKFEPLKDKPTVSKSDLKLWHDIFKQVHPNGVEALAIRSAAAMFPDNSVPRQFIRDLRGAQILGKPKVRHE